MSKKNQDELLPEWFSADDYKALANNSDLTKWAFYFAKRGNYKDKTEFLEDTGGTTTQTTDGVSSTRLSWNNGIFDSTNKSYINDYIDGVRTHLFKKNNGKFISDEEKNEIKNITDTYPVSTSNSSPEMETYKKCNKKSGSNYFPTSEDCENYRRSNSAFQNKTALFFVNLKMPTARLIKQLEKEIERLKKSKRVTPYKNNPHKNFKNWSIGLACFDLKNNGVKRKTIIHRALPLFLNDYSQPIGLNTELDAHLEQIYKKRYKQVKIMIDGKWKQLSGNPEQS